MQKQEIAKTVSIRQQGDEPADDEEDDEEEASEVPVAKPAAKKPPKSAAKRAPGKASAKADMGAAAKAAALRKAMPVDMADDEDAEDGDDFEVTDWRLQFAIRSTVVITTKLLYHQQSISTGLPSLNVTISDHDAAVSLQVVDPRNEDRSGII